MKSLQKFKEFFALTAPEDEFEDDYEDGPRPARRDGRLDSGTGSYRPVSYGAAAVREERVGYGRESYESGMGSARPSALDEPVAVRPHRPAAVAPQIAARPMSSDPRPTSVRPEVRPLAVAEELNPLAKITTVRPRSYGEAQTIGEQFRDGVPVIMDLNDMSNTDAKRLVDFAAGLVFGLRGSFGKVATKVFLISPNGVNVSDDDYRRLAEAGFQGAP